MDSIAQKRSKGIRVVEKRERLVKEMRELEIGDLDSRIELVQALIPIGLKAVGEMLQVEVRQLAGETYSHGNDNQRWGRQGGSVYLSDQKVPIQVPRVRNKQHKREVTLETYRKFQNPQDMDEKVFLKLLNGISTHRYKESCELGPEVFGISPSSVSRKFRKWSEAHLKRLMNRQLDDYDIVAVFIDGKAFARDGLVIALGVTIDGGKVVLGIEQMNAENSRSVGQFIDKLIERGLNYEKGLLVVVDGSKGIIKAVREKFAGYALIQRCQYHKKENVVSYLSPGQQKLWRIRLGQAYNSPDYREAVERLTQLHKELSLINPSAAASLSEGMEETLTVLRLGLPELRRSFYSTNCIESVMSQLGQYTDKVDRWRNGRHIQEWAASGLLRMESGMRKIMGYIYLPLLREKLRQALNLEIKTELVGQQEITEKLVEVGV